MGTNGGIQETRESSGHLRGFVDLEGVQSADSIRTEFDDVDHMKHALLLGGSHSSGQLTGAVAGITTRTGRSTATLARTTLAVVTAVASSTSLTTAPARTTLAVVTAVALAVRLDSGTTAA